MEAFQGFFVKRSPVLANVESYLVNDPCEEMWSMENTEWPVRTLAYLLMEAYDQYRLWYIQPHVSAASRHLDMQVFFKRMAKSEEVTGLLDFIGSVDWDTVPLKQSGATTAESMAFA